MPSQSLSPQLKDLFKQSKAIAKVASPGVSRPTSLSPKGIFASSTPARIPCWLNRNRWLTAVACRLTDKKGIALCRCPGNEITPTTCLSIAKVIAKAVDSTTGRNCALSNNTIAHRAHCGERTVRRAKRVLIQLGLLYEAARGRHLTRHERTWLFHAKGHACIRLASLLHCIMPKNSLAGVVDTGHLPRRGKEIKKSLEISSHQHARMRARGQEKHRKKGVRRGVGALPTTPPPLAAQKLAAGLIRRCPHWGTHHPNWIAHVLASHLDCTTWTANELLRELDTFYQDNNWTTPTTLTCAPRWLNWLLNQLELPTTHTTPQKPPTAAPATPPKTPASKESITRHMQQIRKILNTGQILENHT